MFTDIAILPPLDDMWSLIGSQMEPFPSITHVDYFTLVWEAINKNGGGCDYVSQRVLRESKMENGLIKYGERKYHTLFLVQIDSLHPGTAEKLLEFVSSGGRIFFVEVIPSKSLGWYRHKENDKTVIDLIDQMKSFKDRFILLKRPEKDFIKWYREIQDKYGLTPYLKIDKPDPYLMQNRYQADDGTEVIYLIHSHIHNSYTGKIAFSSGITNKRYGWIWDPETGERSRISLEKDNSFQLDMGPAESLLFVFDRNRNGNPRKSLPAGSTDAANLEEGWTAEFIHCRNGSSGIVKMDGLTDLKDIPERASFAGSVIYRNSFKLDKQGKRYLNLGKVYGLSELTVNGKLCDVKWYGRRIFDISDHLKPGINDIEIKVVTSMGNYMKSLTDNPIAQYWTNEKNKIQPVQSMGLTGPVTLY
jgi:hypothetical protein